MTTPPLPKEQIKSCSSSSIINMSTCVEQDSLAIATSNSFQTFRSLTEKEKHDHILMLLQNVEVRQLRSLYAKMRELLSFDLVSQLPPELSEMVFSYLDVQSLCTAAQCCRSWRAMTNKDSHWYKLCKRKSYMKHSNLSPPAWTEHSRPTSPRYTSPQPLPFNSPLHPPACKWRQIYMKANTLGRHWSMGVYSVAPLLRGHKQRVTCISCEDDHLVSGSSDGSVRVWSIHSLECVHTLENHTDEVNCVIAKDGLIVTGCSDGLVRVIDSRTGQCMNSLSGHTGSVDHIALCGKTLVSAGADCCVRVWEIHTGKLVHTLTGHTEDVECLRLFGAVVLSGSWDHSLRVWDTLVGICTHVLLGHTEVVNCCECVVEGPGETAVAPRMTVSGGGDGVVKVWDLQLGREVVSMAGHSAEVVCIQCDTSVLISSSADSTIRVWKYSGVCQYVLEGHIGVVRCLHLRGNRLTSGGDCKRIVVWNVKTGKQLHTVHRQQILLHRMCVTDTKIITASPDIPGTISIISYW